LATVNGISDREVLSMETGEVQNPFDRKSALTNQVLFSMPVAIGAYAIARYKPRKLPLFLAALAAFGTVWRRFICARCQYYGQECSTMLGVMTARMMPRDESRQLDRNAMIADFAFIGALALMPIPQVLKRFKLTVLYFSAVAASMGRILFNACDRCGNEFCPMKDLNKAISGAAE
jgi:hypothetical protein